MSTKTLKSTFRRSGLLVAAFALVAATVLPAASTYADALNPLTERSLTLSSGSPGWNFRDASGNATYAPPNGGANGQKTGNTFSFRVSSNAAVEGMTFQYCTTPAGNCLGPGDNGYSAGSPGTNDAVRQTNAQGLLNTPTKTSDLEVVHDPLVATVGEIGSGATAYSYGTNFDALLGQPNVVPANGYDPDNIHPNMPALNGDDGHFIVLYKANSGDNWAQMTGWEMTADIRQTKGGNGTPATESDGTSTNKKNFITLANDGSTPALTAGSYVKVIFFATDDTYITNPGSKEFFVKINTYSSDTVFNDTTLIDGGVTVANVMNRSIEIQTKVLETMQFSVGTVDPNTLNTGTTAFTDATGRAQHAPCDPIVQGMNLNTTTPNVLQLGDADGEFSLRTDTTYSTHSYWRLSSNSSGGATVYYAGTTLSNTVGDQIRPIGKTAQTPTQGGEQFGLALDNRADEDPGTAGVQSTQGHVSYAKERAAGFQNQNGADNAVAGVHATTIAQVGSNLSWHTPRLSPLNAKANYANGTGVVNIETGDPFDYAGQGYTNTAPSYASFAFDPDSNVIPTPIADGNQVLDCVTGKMRYIANIAATTPAGIYTTKINYIAAPKY